jgi:hypothetical protein
VKVTNEIVRTRVAELVAGDVVSVTVQLGGAGHILQQTITQITRTKGATSALIELEGGVRVNMQLGSYVSRLKWENEQ